VVCQLCGAANPPQQVSCVSCGSPLERVPVRRGARKHAEGRGGRLIWIGICLVFGGVLGFALGRLRYSEPRMISDVLPMILAGAILGVALGALPGPAIWTIRRGWGAAVAALCEAIFLRQCVHLRRKTEASIEQGHEPDDAQCRLAALFWLEGRRDRAVQILESLLSSSKNSTIAEHNLAVAHASSGRYDRALQGFERTRAEKDFSPTCCCNIGLVRWAQRQYEQAASAFQDAIELDPDHFLARNGLALVRAMQGNIEEATSELQMLLSRHRHHADILCNLGIIRQYKGELDAAESYFSEALRSDPSHIAARYDRGICAMLSGRYLAAIEDFTALSRIAPDHAWALIQKAIAWYRLGRKPRVLDTLRSATLAGGADFLVRYNAGTLLLREEMIDRAVSELEKAYDINSDSIDVVVNLGVAMYIAGHLRQALDHFRVATRMNSKHALARYNMVVSSSMMDRLSEAENEVERLIELYPGFADAFNAIGVVRLLQGRLVEAAEQFRRLVDMMPRSAAARANLALTYYFEGDLSAAREQAQYAIGLDSKMGPALDVAGHVALEMDNLQEAISHFRSLTKTEPSNPDAHSNLGLAYYRDDKLRQAIETYKRVLVFAPNSPEGHNDLGLAYAKDKMLEEAAYHLAKVIKWRPDNPILHSNLGLVYYFKGDTEKAVHEWREVTRLSPKYARLREATRFSAYDDQEMAVRTIDRKARVAHLPLKTAAFRHSFQWALNENEFKLELPWPDIARCGYWQERAKTAQ